MTSSTAAEPVGVGVIGGASFVANAAVIPAIATSTQATLVAVASANGRIDRRWASVTVDDYDAVIDHPDVEAVYVPLPNGMHREWTERIAAAGKHVLCEKPLAPDPTTARAMFDACSKAGVLLAEAWMTPFHRRYRHVLELVAHGEIGTVERIESAFTFTIGPDAADNYRWDPEQGGGALLDVGIYCLGPVVELFDAQPDHVDAHRTTTARGVDATTHASLRWDDGRTATIICSFVDDERQTLHVSGSGGSIDLDTEAFTAGVDDREIRLDAGGTVRAPTVDANDPYLTMVDDFCLAVRGEREWARPAGRSIELLELVERIAEAST